MEKLRISAFPYHQLRSMDWPGGFVNQEAGSTQVNCDLFRSKESNRWCFSRRRNLPWTRCHPGSELASQPISFSPKKFLGNQSCVWDFGSTRRNILSQNLWFSNSAGKYDCEKRYFNGPPQHMQWTHFYVLEDCFFFVVINVTCL